MQSSLHPTDRYYKDQLIVDSVFNTHANVGDKLRNHPLATRMLGGMATKFLMASDRRMQIAPQNSKFGPSYEISPALPDTGIAPSETENIPDIDLSQPQIENVTSITSDAQAREVLVAAEQPTKTSVAA